MTIYNEKEMKRIIDFKDFKLNNSTPTDIDFVYEKNNKCWIIGEVKKEGVEVPKGQNLLFSRWLDNHAELNIATLYIHAVHNTPCNQDINLAELSIKTGIAVLPNKSGVWEKLELDGLENQNVFEITKEFLLIFGG